MPLVRLGKMLLRWCHQCQLPVLEDEACGSCGGPTHEVQLTPPGDARPAFAHDLEIIARVVDSQFGEGCGNALLPEGRLVLMNKIPGLDRMDEVVLDGEVAGTLRYDLGRGFAFVGRMGAARAIQSSIAKGFVIAADDAVPFIAQGLNLLVPGVEDADPRIGIGDEVVVLTKRRQAICTGMARMTGDQMLSAERGMAVKARWQGTPSDMPDATRSRTWQEALAANAKVMERRVGEAVGFIHRTREKFVLPNIVSFSGGKDSLACLLLTLDAGLRLPVFFVDTGLEFPETVDHVHQVAEKHGLPLIVEAAPPEAFFGNLDYFGPPGRDFRWCCKTNKLGPTVRAILKHYPDGVLSFIGQRRYESEQRSEKPRVWKNPWTPGQVGASPIQDWTALHVWLYIFSKGEEYNPWYEWGLDRIGCFLCPASDLAELELVMDRSPRSQEWRAFLERRAGQEGWSEDWIRYALWRWRRLPEAIRKDLEAKGASLQKRTVDRGRAQEPVRLRMQEGVSPCVMGFSVEGAFNRDLDLERVANLLCQLGEVEASSEEGWCKALDVRVFDNGALVAKGREPDQIRRNVERVRRAVVKAEECVGCGVCIARCHEGALTMERDKVLVLTAKCIHCGRCTEPCPAISFGDAPFEL
ncbi:MAG TPA: phosphoadenosine phosphosulfate reductase family protein [Methanomassiliicoccales archaeon]|nr:phosphoadenosine phosphosulfate reductase family protein [Methanomassiliicoccales archaeon]